MIMKELYFINCSGLNVNRKRGRPAITNFETDIIAHLISIFLFLLLSLVIDQNNKSNYIHISRSSDNRRNNGEWISAKIHVSPLLCHIMAYPMRNGKLLLCSYIYFLLYCDILNVIQLKKWFFK